MRYFPADYADKVAQIFADVCGNSNHGVHGVERRVTRRKKFCASQNKLCETPNSMIPLYVVGLFQTAIAPSMQPIQLVQRFEINDQHALSVFNRAD